MMMPDGSYSLSDIQDYFEYIFKKHGKNIDKPSVKIYKIFSDKSYFLKNF